MPQLLFPTNPAAIGLEVAFLSYLMRPGGVAGNMNWFGLGTDLTHALLTGGLYFAYNTYVHDLAIRQGVVNE